MLQEAGQEPVLSGPSAWCCNLDADVPRLLTAKEEQQYLERQLRAEARFRNDLVPCPQPDCEGVAVIGQGETDVGRTSSECSPGCVSLFAAQIVLTRQKWAEHWSCIVDSVVRRALREQTGECGLM